MITRKIWTQSEVEELICQSVVGVLTDARARMVKWSATDIASQVYYDLTDQGLIELEP